MGLSLDKKSNKLAKSFVANLSGLVSYGLAQAGKGEYVTIPSIRPLVDWSSMPPITPLAERNS